jgi:hypothetical protein
MGRKSFDNTVGDGGWGDAGPVGETPCFVVTHTMPTVSHPPVFTFVTDGVVSAIEQAKNTAGDKVVGLHGATIMQQALPLGLRRDTRARDPGPGRWRHPAVRHARRTDHPRTHPSASYPGGDTHRVGVVR